MIDYKLVLTLLDTLVIDKKAKSIINSVNESQLESKKWLVEKLKPYLSLIENPKICVAAGWYGLTAHLLKEFTNEKIVSFDIDEECKRIGKKLYQGIKFETADIKDYSIDQFDIIICTSCEHLSDKVINNFISRKKRGSLVVLQSNNMVNVDEHINCKNSLDDFVSSLEINLVEKCEKQIKNYTRYMVIGT